MSTKHPILLLLDRLEKDNRTQAAVLTELREAVASLNLPDPRTSECPECGTKFRNRLAMAEHLYNAHSGPVPAHYLAAEAAAGLEPLEAA